MSDLCTVSSGAAEDLAALSDRALVVELARRASGERHATADVLRVLIEVDRRRLYLAEGYSSLFAYCTEALNYSEHGAFNRIEVARAAARWPQLLACLEDGSLHLSGARLLAPHLTPENVEQALADARHKSKREIEEMAARLAQRTMLIAVDTEHYRLHLTISRQTRDTLRQVQALIAHQVPDANAAVIFEQALSVLLEKLQQQRFADTPRPRVTVPGPTRSRHIPAAVRRRVWRRDAGQCAFVGRQGRCGERTMLEFHHVVPYAAGGGATDDNLELRCRAHNGYEADLYFGDGSAGSARKAAGSGTGRLNPSPANPSPAAVAVEAPIAEVAAKARDTKARDTNAAGNSGARSSQTGRPGGALARPGASSLGLQRPEPRVRRRRRPAARKGHRS
jgi:hypothetical protein